MGWCAIGRFTGFCHGIGGFEEGLCDEHVRVMIILQRRPHSMPTTHLEYSFQLLCVVELQDKVHEAQVLEGGLLQLASSALCQLLA